MRYCLYAQVDAGMLLAPIFFSGIGTFTLYKVSDMLLRDVFFHKTQCFMEKQY